MKPDLVADVGNSRIKWGRCLGGFVTEIASLEPDATATWEQQLAFWNATGKNRWVVCGVHPPRRDRLTEWIRERGDEVLLLHSWDQLPIRMAVPHKERVGIDRLLNAVAAKTRVAPKTPIIIVDAGTAVTVDWVDETGAFAGGAIFPGFRLMAQALHDYTAKLPVVEVPQWPHPQMPAATTAMAIEAGVFWAVAGGVQALVRELCRHSDTKGPPEIFLTGGNGSLIAPTLDHSVQLWREMTLEGLRISAEAIP